eukprot:TRINITY_DN1946_c0_g1_i4.p2 TRINITY_DN1946_c0_g1~~TRINITY_DN1946_c0_g1_i4.p2  ORF type:complete len:195 (+),score=44.60 TRINITY_DN1946_c0_g1_i4:339-923(+)
MRNSNRCEFKVCQRRQTHCRARDKEHHAVPCQNAASAASVRGLWLHDWFDGDRLHPSVYARRSSGTGAAATTAAKPVVACHCMEIRAAATQKAEVPAARACGEASLAAAVFVAEAVAFVAFDAGADVGAEVASWRSGASSGSTLPPLYWVSVEATLVAAGTAAAESAAATVWAAKANAIKEMQRMVKDVPARVE